VDVQNVVQIVTTDKAKTQAYCDLTKLYDQVQAAEEKNDTKTVETLTKQADGLVDKLGPEYSKMIEGLEEVDLTSNEGKELMSILSGLDKPCTR
jgi:ABC-type transporter Mla subunit MlaD